MAENASTLSFPLTDFNNAPGGIPIAELFGMVQARALVVSMKEIYGWLLIAGLFSLLIILLSYSPLRPAAIFPKWKTIRRTLRHIVRLQQ